MPIRLKFVLLTFVLSVFACKPSGLLPTNTPVPALTLTSQISQNGLSATKITDDPALVDFGSLHEGFQIYYAISSSTSTRHWYQFDFASQTVSEIDDPFPTAEILPLLQDNGTAKVSAISLSPDGKKALYTKTTEESVPSTPSVGGDYFPPADLWLADDGGRKRNLLLTNFASACGELSSKNIWRLDGALVLGTCNPYYGLPNRFIVDTDRNALNMLRFKIKTTSEQIEAYQANISYDGKRLVFIDQEGSLWILPQAELFVAAEEGLDNKYRVLVKNSVYAPEWSLDGQVYYWHRLATTGQVPITWELKKLDPESGKNEIVITTEEFEKLMGTDWSEKFAGYLLPGFENGWSLYPHGNKAVLALGDSYRIESLWLLTW